MEFKLTVQSLSPLALLTIIKNFDFVPVGNSEIGFSVKEFILANLVLLLVLCFCAMWVLLSIWYYIEFKAFQYTDKESGYGVKHRCEKTEGSIDFFVSYIFPLLIDNINTWQGAAVFFITFFTICTLILKTKLFYANPILVILGYKIYEFNFDEKSKFNGNNVIGICIGTMPETITYKKITDTLVYVKGEK